ncbi:MAG TPA: biotin/lipoyl-containing protein [Gaiellaceae bacterium]|nr:biotin/lipoyl-containing protein [Gaiellaceae bacterium]
MLEIVLTREDANSESALLAEWLVADRADVRKGSPVCVIETSKASIEVEAPGDGTLVQLVEAGVEVEIGTTVAVVARDDAELSAAAARLERSRDAAAAAVGDERPRNVTRRAAELAERHGLDLSEIDKTGFVTVEDVERLLAARREPERAHAAGDPILAGLSTDGVTLPALFGIGEEVGRLDEAFLAELRADPDAFAALAGEEKCERYRAAGAVVGEDVRLGPGAVVVAPRIVLEDGAAIDEGGRVECAEVFALGALSRFGPRLRLACRRAYVGTGLWAGGDVVIGGGGHRDPWATLVVGDDAFIGDEVFLNVCRPVLLGAETFVTMRSLFVTHNVGHSLLEGFENRFAGIVVEDRAQVGLGAVVYAGSRIGREAIVVSNSYVVHDVPAGKLAAGVPARVTGSSSRPPRRSRQVELARELVGDLHELLAARGVPVERLEVAGAVGLEVAAEEGRGRVVLVETLAGGDEIPTGEGETVVLTLELAGGPPAGAVVLDLLARRAHGEGGVLADSVREYCRKRGIRFAPGPWRYRGGLV